jgi:hypothetical protein
MLIQLFKTCEVVYFDVGSAAIVRFVSYRSVKFSARKSLSVKKNCCCYIQRSENRVESGGSAKEG